MKPQFSALFSAALFVSLGAGCQAQENSLTVGAKATQTVEAVVKPGGTWKSYPTRTLADLPAIATAPIDTDLDEYGGLKNRKEKATGFFYAKKIGDRWWLIDPVGGLYINKGVVSVQPSGTQKDATRTLFGDEAGWAKETGALLRQTGFNGTGAWSNDALLKTATPRLAYTPIWNFMSAYGKQRGGTFQQSGHMGYPNDAIFVFDPEFETFCDQYAKKLVVGKDDPYLLGHFSDNELPFRRNALKGYLTMPEGDKGRVVAEKWMAGRHGVGAGTKDITSQDEIEFNYIVAERYFRIVSQAIKKYDPNHLFLGSRLNGGVLKRPEIFRAAGPYLDVIAVNYYDVWTPRPDSMKMWMREAGKPVIITEWYVKGEDSGMGNTTGAGWLVKTQADRGKFYQNFTLGLIESKMCVGWHWFKYADNDPASKTADPSNLDSNKGIMTATYVKYPPLLDAMRELNQRAYRLTDYFDALPKP